VLILAKAVTEATIDIVIREPARADSQSRVAFEAI
jgi:hypothetical protein